jgi:hypothetical protein
MAQVCMTVQTIIPMEHILNFPGCDDRNPNGASLVKTSILIGHSLRPGHSPRLGGNKSQFVSQYLFSRVLLPRQDVEVCKDNSHQG